MQPLYPFSSLFVRFSWFHIWQLILNVGVFFFAITLGLLVTRRAFLLIVLIPLAFIPFSYARARLQMLLNELLGKKESARTLLLTLTGLGIVCDVVMLAQLFTARTGQPYPILHGPGVSWVGAIWFSAHALFFLGRMLVSPIHWIVNLVSQLVRPSATYDADTLASPKRRQFLQQAGLLSAGAPFLISLSNIKLSYDFRVEEREIILSQWPPELDGLRIAHLSDIHVGGSMNKQRLLHIAALTNDARPELVFHTGDFLTHRTGNFDAPLYEALTRINAPYGQWACLGNHDFDTPEHLVQNLSQAGVTVLRDTVRTLSIQGQSLEIAGLDYLFGQHEWAERYMQSIRSWSPRTNTPRLLLNHDPRAFAALPEGCADLVLSGHTHGGHVGIQLSHDTALTVVGLLGIPDQGIFHRQDMQLYVTRCVGFYGYPMRLGIPPEIALLTIRSPKHAA